jgi:hypothetical protein
MGSHDPLGYLKHKLWPKERSGVKLPIWFPTTKNQESPWFTCVQVEFHIFLESSQQGLQLCFRPHLNWRSTKKNYGLPKSQESPISGISGPPTWEFGTKWHLGVGPMARHKKYFKGEGGGFPQVHVVVSLASSWTKSAPTTH